MDIIGSSSELAYNLDGKYKNFKGKMAIDDYDYVGSIPYTGTRVAGIYGDGKLLKEYNLDLSKGLTDFDVDVTGVSKLEIKCDDGNLNTCGFDLTNVIIK